MVVVMLIPATVISPVGSWSSYTPQLTASSSNPTLGSGSVQNGRFTQIGKLIIVHIRVHFGSSGAAAGSGTYFISVPVTGTFFEENFQTIGSGNLFDSSANTNKISNPQWDSTSRDRFQM